MRLRLSRGNTLLLLMVCSLLLLNGCSMENGRKQRIVSAYQENKVAFANAIQNSDFSEVELIDVIEAISISQN